MPQANATAARDGVSPGCGGICAVSRQLSTPRLRSPVRATWRVGAHLADHARMPAKVGRAIRPLQWPWPTAASAPADPVADRSRCSARPTVLRASRPTCSTMRAATPGEDGAEGTPGEDGAGSTPGEDGAGSTPGEDGVDSVNGAMSLRYLCRCCC